MKIEASDRILDAIEDNQIVSNFLQELCLYKEGRADLPVIHQTHDSVLVGYMEQVVEAVVEWKNAHSR